MNSEAKPKAIMIVAFFKVDHDVSDNTHPTMCLIEGHSQNGNGTLNKLGMGISRSAESGHVEEEDSGPDQGDDKEGMIP